jgi:hypothetical protein
MAASEAPETPPPQQQPRSSRPVLATALCCVAVLIRLVESRSEGEDANEPEQADQEHNPRRDASRATGCESVSVLLLCAACQPPRLTVCSPQPLEDVCGVSWHDAACELASLQMECCWSAAPNGG